MASRRKSIFEYNAQFHVFDLNGDGNSEQRRTQIGTNAFSLSLALDESFRKPIVHTQAFLACG